MKEVQRRLAITAWRQLFTLPEHRIDAEDRYERLLRAADDMERDGLITSVEWRKLAQQAGTLLASTAECMLGVKQQGEMTGKSRLPAQEITHRNRE
jgi:hypothetical protein